MSAQDAAENPHGDEAARRGGAGTPLIPDVERALEASAYSNPRGLIRLIGPVLGRALRYAFRDWLRHFLERVNYRVLRSFSSLGLRWRWKAFREGKTFDEILIEQQVLGSVEQVLLIHRETGLLLAEAAMVGNDLRNGDAVSGMLTAIQDFVHDSFDVSTGGRLNSFQVGNLKVWIERGSSAVLAAVVRGRAPDHLEAGCRAVLDRIHLEWAEALQDFSGNTAPFRHARRYLKECLVKAEGRVGGRILPMTWAVLAVPLLAAALWGYSAVANRTRWQACLKQIAARPGVVITEAGRRNGKFWITGLKDPMTADPVDIFAMAGLDARQVEASWEPYQALEPELQLIRIRRMLNPPSTVSLNLFQDILSASGHASCDWIHDAKTLARGFTGVSRFDTSKLLDLEKESEQRWEEYIHSLSEVPGVFVTSEGQHEGKRFVNGLRDPLSTDPVALMNQAGFADDAVTSHWEPFESLLPAFVMKRAQRRLNPPEGVRLELDGAVLRATGKSRHAWIDRARHNVIGITGVAALDTSRLLNTDMATVVEIQKRIEERVFKFLVDTPDLWPGQAAKLARLAIDIDEIQQKAVIIGRTVTIEIRGHETPTKNDAKDLAASESTARRFLSMLSARKVDTARIISRGMGSELPAHPDQSDDTFNRYVSIKIIYTPPLDN